MSGYDPGKSDAKQYAVVAETRRKWSDAEKEAALADAASGSVSAAARKHGVAASLLFRWRRDAADASKKPGRKKAPSFVPVNVPALTLSPTRPANAADTRHDTAHGVIEIELRGGHKLRVSGLVEADILKQVIAALDGR